MEFRWRTDSHSQIPVSLRAGRIARGSHQIVAPLGIVIAENFQRRAIKRVRIPLAFDRVHGIAVVRQDEVDLMPALIAPILHGRVGKMRL